MEKVLTYIIFKYKILIEKQKKYILYIFFEVTVKKIIKKSIIKSSYNNNKYIKKGKESQLWKKQI